MTEIGQEVHLIRAFEFYKLVLEKMHRTSQWSCGISSHEQIKVYCWFPHFMSFPGGTVVEDLSASAGDAKASLILESGRFLEEG